MLRDAGNSNLPPPALLEALCAPRRTQLHDSCVRDLFRRWKRQRRPITLQELRVLADLVAPGDEICVDQINKIMAALDAAEITVGDAEEIVISGDDLTASISG